MWAIYSFGLPALSAHLPCQPTWLVSLPALFVPSTGALVFSYGMFVNYAMSNLLLLDICGCDTLVQAPLVNLKEKFLY